MSARRVVRRAPAKVNLTLSVLGRRPDGYHELDSLMWALPLADRIEVIEAPEEAGLALEVTGPASGGVPSDGSNLALRAARAVLELARERGRGPKGARFLLEKHVPAEAGLGGGSSDAIAAGLACAELWGLPAEDDELAARLAALGSDCAFFLRARATGFARCRGRGERVEPLAPLVLPWTLALLTPSFGCSTAAVYGALGSLPPRPPARELAPETLVEASLEVLSAWLSNDLEEAARRVSPPLRELRARLEELAPGRFHLAGSGSSCFGFFPDAPAAEALLERLVSEDRGRRFALRGRWVLPPGGAAASSA